MRCAFLRKAEAGRRAQEPVTVTGRVLYLSKKAVKLWMPIGDIWIPFSEIPADELAKLKVGEDAAITIPRWLAREKGLGE